MRSSFLLSVLLLSACSKREAAPEPEKVAASPAPSATAPQPSAPSQPTPGDPHSALANPHAPVPSAGAVPTEAARAGGITWDAPPPFERRAPKSSMRAAEYGVAGAPDTELSVFYFGADQGGSVEANMTRWIGQLKGPDGAPPEPKRTTRTVKGVDVALVEARGTYSGGMAMPGGPAPKEIGKAALLGAIAKGPDGSVFFKLVGPEAEVESARAGFEGLVDSIHKAK